MNKLQEVYEILEQFIVVSSATDEFRNKQHFFETSEVDETKRAPNPQHSLLGELGRINAFQCTCFSQLIVPDTVTVPKTKVDSP